MFARLPIKLKLTLITLVTSVLALVACSTGFLFYDLATFKIKMTNDLRTEAEVISANCSAGATFGDKQAVDDVLASLKSKASIEAAAVYTPDGKLFSRFRRAGERIGVPTGPDAEGLHFGENGITLWQKIKSGRDTVGILYMRSDLDEWTARRDSYMSIMGTIMLVCALMALGVGSRLQRAISLPILDLATTMRAVAEDETYSRRAPKTTQDEIGELVDGFNAMLAEIEERDRELHLANEYLENRVQRRTSELEKEIAERKATQEELSASRQSLEDFFENATIGLHWLAPDGTILRANRAELEMLGYRAEEYVGRNLAEFHEEPDRIREVLRRLASGEAVSYEARMLCKDGRVKDIATESSGRWDGGSFVHARCFTRDLTEQKEAERATRAREQAERANQAKSEFLSRMSHELRTPMNAIMGFGQILAMDDLTEDQRDSVDRLMGAGKHLLQLINEVLDISRIEARDLALSKEPVPVAEAVGEIVSLVRPLADARGISIQVEPTADVHAQVIADRQRLRQVLLNLVSNAIKYNVEQGEVRIDWAPLGSLLRITVADTGPGIPESKASLIFTPFERLGAEQTAIEGTGLGLALSKNLVEAMGGRIGLQPTAKGACFSVDLPEAANSVDALQGLALTLHHANSGGREGVVLLVEDNPSNIRLMEKLLARESNLRLEVAMTGEDGLAKANECDPDLILLDLNLPDLGGEEVLRQLQTRIDTRSIPTIVISADATESQVRRLKAAGAREYLTKPIEVDLLLAFLERYLPKVRHVA